MVDFNGFDKGVIGKKLPADTTLNCMKKSELIKLLHLAEDNHRVLAEAYKIAVDTSKCKICPLGLDKRRADEIKADVIREIEQAMYHQCFECDNDKNMQKWDGGNWFRYKLFENVLEQIKEQKHEKDEIKA